MRSMRSLMRGDPSELVEGDRRRHRGVQRLARRSGCAPTRVACCHDARRAGPRARRRRRSVAVADGDAARAARPRARRARPRARAARPTPRTRASGHREDRAHRGPHGLRAVGVGACPGRARRSRRRRRARERSTVPTLPGSRTPQSATHSGPAGAAPSAARRRRARACPSPARRPSRAARLDLVAVDRCRPRERSHRRASPPRRRRRAGPRPRRRSARPRALAPPASWRMSLSLGLWWEVITGSGTKRAPSLRSGAREVARCRPAG